jgi:hypothetical protein
MSTSLLPAFAKSESALCSDIKKILFSFFKGILGAIFLIKLLGEIIFFNFVIVERFATMQLQSEYIIENNSTLDSDKNIDILKTYPQTILKIDKMKMWFKKIERDATILYSIGLVFLMVKGFEFISENIREKKFRQKHRMTTIFIVGAVIPMLLLITMAYFHFGAIFKVMDAWRVVSCQLENLSELSISLKAGAINHDYGYQVKLFSDSLRGLETRTKVMMVFQMSLYLLFAYSLVRAILTKGSRDSHSRAKDKGQMISAPAL